MAAKYRVTTLGCKVNQYESQQIREILESFGLKPAGIDDPADLAVVNTCAVTAEASRKNRQAIRRQARNGRTRVVVVGCGAGADASRLSELNGVTAVFGHETDVATALRSFMERQQLTRLVPESHRQMTANREPLQRPRVLRNDGSIKPAVAQPGQDASTPRTTNLLSPILSTQFSEVKQDPDLLSTINAFARHQRALLKVQDGCDAYCTYCIIPRLRADLRSKPIEVAVQEARQLIHAGHKEIVITGIFLGAYGRDSALRRRWSKGRSPLARLVDALAGVKGLHRLRLSSLEPGDVDESLLDALASHESCVPHLHLPLQAGSPALLKRMNRQYTRDDYLAMIDQVRSALDRPAITTDIIAGFPGESDADFEASVEIARQAQFAKIHAFPFSPREGTAAARWTDDFIPKSVVRERMARLTKVEQECSLQFRSRFVGHLERVIVERNHPRKTEPDDATSWHSMRHGRADRYFPIHFDAPDARPGDLVPVRIDRVTPTRTHGSAITSNHNALSLPVLSYA